MIIRSFIRRERRMWLLMHFPWNMVPLFTLHYSWLVECSSPIMVRRSKHFQPDTTTTTWLLTLLYKLGQLRSSTIKVVCIWSNNPILNPLCCLKLHTSIRLGHSSFHKTYDQIKCSFFLGWHKEEYTLLWLNAILSNVTREKQWKLQVH